jgi:hypothetical protein
MEGNRRETTQATPISRNVRQSQFQHYRLAFQTRVSENRIRLKKPARAAFSKVSNFETPKALRPTGAEEQSAVVSRAPISPIWSMGVFTCR